MIDVLIDSAQAVAELAMAIAAVAIGFVMTLTVGYALAFSCLWALGLPPRRR